MSRNPVTRYAIRYALINFLHTFNISSSLGATCIMLFGQPYIIVNFLTLLVVYPFFFISASQPIVGLYSQPFSGFWPPLSRFLDHTQRRATLGRTPLNEWSGRRRDLNLTTHNTHNRQTAMPSVGFEPTISAGERPYSSSPSQEIVHIRLNSTVHCRVSESLSLSWARWTIVQCCIRANKWSRVVCASTVTFKLLDIYGTLVTTSYFSRNLCEAKVYFLGAKMK